MEVIRKYKNRKLYSTKISKYVNMGYVIDLLKSKQRFKIIDDNDINITSNIVIKSIANSENSTVTLLELYRELYNDKF